MFAFLSRRAASAVLPGFQRRAAAILLAGAGPLVCAPRAQAADPSAEVKPREEPVSRSGAGAVSKREAGTGAPAVPTAAGVQPTVIPWASDQLCGQVLALSVNDSGRVFAAVTARSFGRGTVWLGDDAALREEDRNLWTVGDRVKAAQAWLAAGQLNPRIADRQLFFKEPEGGAENFLTRFSESVRRLDDTRNAGAADRAVTVAEGFRDPADGAGGALLALGDGTLLYGCPPRLWRLAVKGGQADLQDGRTVVAEGFGLRNGEWEAGLHALLEAPDGWIYFGMGDRGYRIHTADGGKVRGLGGGAIFRCRPDGSGLEVFATGLHNPTGLAMDAEGRLFAMDQAVPGGRTRLLLVIPGADFGWQAESVTEPGKGWWFEENMETLTSSGATGDQPLWCLPPVARLKNLEASTLEFAAQTQAGAGRPLLLAADCQGGGKGGLVTLHLEPAGSSFQLVKTVDVWRGGAVPATALAPDGSLFFADWGTSPDVFSHCQIRKLEWPAGPGPVSGKPTGQIQFLTGLPVRQLLDLLESPLPRVRLRAGRQLATLPFQESLEPLLRLARKPGNLPARLQAVWAAGAVTGGDAVLLSEVARLVRDPEPVVRATTVTVLGGGRFRETPSALRAALTDASPTVRMAAAAALGRLKTPGAATDLITAAAHNDSGDPFVRSSLAAALALAVPAWELATEAQASESQEARLTAVHALRRLAAPELAVFLCDPDPRVRPEAVRAVYDLPVFPALPALAEQLNNTAARQLPESCMRRVLAAALRGGIPSYTVPIADLALALETPVSLKLAALETLAAWDQPPVWDPVRPRRFLPLPRLPGLAREALHRAASGLKAHSDSTLSARAKALLRSPAGAEPPSSAGLLTLTQNSGAPEDTRLAAVRTLIVRNALPPDTALALCAADSPAPPAVRAEARSLLMRRDPKTAATLAGNVLLNGSSLEKQAAIRTLNHLPGRSTDHEGLLLSLARSLAQGSLEPAIQVEVLEALQQRDVESRSPWRKATEAWLASMRLDIDPLAYWRMATAGGDPAAGQLIFETQPDAHCTACHSIQGQGGITGPALDGVADRLIAGGLLEAVVHPGARAAPGAESGPGDSAKPDSSMPPMGPLLTARELRDLIAWLGTLKTK